MRLPREQRARLGSKVRALRRGENLNQSELAERLGISASYLNLIENNHRPLTADLLIRLSQLFDIELNSFAAEEGSRTQAALYEAFSDPLFESQDVPAAEVRALVGESPALARAVLCLYRSYRTLRESSELMASRLCDGETGGGLVAHVSSEEVADLIQQHVNYFPELEAAAEGLWQSAGLAHDDLYPGLVRHLQKAYGIEVCIEKATKQKAGQILRSYDAEAKRLTLSELLPNRSRRMQLAYQIGLLSQGDVLDRLTTSPLLTTEESKTLARAALANYFAAAVLMPYDAFLRAAREQRYDLEVIGRRFGTGFEQVAHRLTTLRRKGAEGVPFHMIRIDVAGNISKHFSASGIQIARFSGACPRWNIFQAFSTPGMIRIQLSRMPDNQSYFCIARTVQGDNHGFQVPPRVHVIGLGCPASRARELVYSDGLDLSQDAAVPVGITCRLCERGDCEQRAFPSLSRSIRLDENVRGLSLYTEVRDERTRDGE